MLQAFLVWLGVILTIRLLSFAATAVPFIAEINGALTAIVLIYPPVILGVMTKADLSYWKIDRQTIWNGVKWFLIASLVVFPPAFFVNHFYQKIFFQFSYSTAAHSLWGSYIVSQLLLVGFPEEFFFRGYFQEQMGKAMPPAHRILSVPFGRAQILTSLVFALSHTLITVQWWHALIFFPSLVFSWLKERTGSIWAGTLFHATCNFFAYWVALHYFKAS